MCGFGGRCCAELCTPALAVGGAPLNQNISMDRKTKLEASDPSGRNNLVHLLPASVPEAPPVVGPAGDPRPRAPVDSSTPVSPPATSSRGGVAGGSEGERSPAAPGSACYAVRVSRGLRCPLRVRPRGDEQVFTQHAASAPVVIRVGRLATPCWGPFKSKAHPAHDVSEITPRDTQETAQTSPRKTQPSAQLELRRPEHALKWGVFGPHFLVGGLCPCRMRLACLVSRAPQ